MNETLTPAHIAARAEYDASLEVFRAASREYRIEALKYRNREISTSEFAPAIAKFKAAEAAADIAELAFIDFENANS